MNKEEIKFALTQSNIDRAVSDEILEQLECYENREFFSVIRTCKDDMKDEFEASPKIQLEIEQFTDEQTENIAKDIGEQLEASYWVALREAVERELSR